MLFEGKLEGEEDGHSHTAKANTRHKITSCKTKYQWHTNVSHTMCKIHNVKIKYTHNVPHLILLLHYY